MRPKVPTDLTYSFLYDCLLWRSLHYLFVTGISLSLSLSLSLSGLRFFLTCLKISRLWAHSIQSRIYFIQGLSIFLFPLRTGVCSYIASSVLQGLSFLLIFNWIIYEVVLSGYVSISNCWHFQSFANEIIKYMVC